VLLHGRDRAALVARAAELGGNAGTLAFDVTDAAAVGEAFSQIERLDILVNNAGIIPRKPVLETTDEDWQSVIDANLTAYFRMSREAARLMVPQGRGRIIMVSSIMGLLAQITYVDLVGVDDPEVARELVLRRVRETLVGRARPSGAPGYPGAPGRPPASLTEAPLPVQRPAEIVVVGTDFTPISISAP